MKLPSFDPTRIRSPFQLLGALALVGLGIAGAFIWGATRVNDSPWLAVVLALAGLAVFAALCGLIYVLLTKYRGVMRADEFFQDFEPDVVQVSDDSGSPTGGKSSLEALRIERYVQNKGLFLSHVWRPSRASGQVADIEIFVRQHRDGPLKEDRVEFVEYQLGPKFSERLIRQVDPADGFRLDVSAYGPMLCIAQVKLRDPEEVLLLYRYIDFPPIEGQQAEPSD